MSGPAAGVEVRLANPRGFCAGVDRAIEILGSEIARTMRLLGVTSLEELEPGHVTQLQRLVPRS